MKIQPAYTLIMVALLSACATQEVARPQTEKPVSALPAWVNKPAIENGFSDTQCINVNADMNILKSKATALARAEIARQIDLSVKAMDKTYENMTDTVQGSTSGQTFDAVSKQLTQATLKGSRAVKVDYINFPDNTQKFCVRVELSPQKTKALFDGLIAGSRQNISPTSEAVLYQQFLAKKASDEMDFELSKKTNKHRE